MSKRSAKSRRRSGHPARVAARQAAPARKPPPQPRRQKRTRRPLAAGRTGLALRSWAATIAGAVVNRQQTPIRESADLDRHDVLFALLTGAASAVLFATTLRSHVALGDAPETVAGVSALGILHAPGYPSYVLAAHLFTYLVPFGSEAFRVNLFSLLCGAATVTGVNLLARRAGASRMASAVAALLMAAGAGFWFYADFAKHDMFSALLLLVALYLTVDLDSRGAQAIAVGAGRRLAGLGVAIGAGLGSSWPLTVLLIPTVLIAVLRWPVLRTARRLAVGSAAALLTMVAVYGFVLVRAGENPPLNWGQASSVSALVNLVNRSDFTGAGATPTVASQTSRGAAPVSRQSLTDGALGREIAQAGFYRLELGWIGLAAVLWGVTLATWRRRRRAALPIAVTFAVSLIGTATIVGTTRTGTYDFDLAEEGFLFGCYFPLVCWIALGFDDFSRRVLARLLSRVSRGRRLLPGVAAVLGLATIGLSVGAHAAVEKRTARPLADQYAASVFAELPRHAVLFIWGAEFTQPLVYRQVVDGDRPDVTVIAAEGLSYPWYREQTARRLHLVFPPSVGNSVVDARSVVHAVMRSRAVYVDPLAGQILSTETPIGKLNPGRPIGYEPVGIVARAVPGTGSIEVEPPSALAAAVSRAERTAGIPAPDWHMWPNENLAFSVWETAALEVARAYNAHHDFVGMARWLRNVLAINPHDLAALGDLAKLIASQNPAALHPSQSSGPLNPLP